MTTNNEKPKLSEVEAQMMRINLRIQKHIRDTKKRLHHINEQLKNDSISEKEKIDLEGAKIVVEQNIQKMRFAGLFNEYRPINKNE